MDLMQSQNLVVIILCLQQHLQHAEGDDFTAGNDFRTVGLIADPTLFGTTTVATGSTLQTNLCC